jgi:hypothetical protein
MIKTVDPGGGPDAGGGRAGAVARATGLTIAFVLLSRVLGLLRDRVLAQQFGQNADTTIFTRAFAVPDLIALVIAGGAFSAVFLPVFAEYWNDRREDDAWRVFGTVVTIVAVAVAALVIGMEIFALPLTQRLNPRFSADALRETAALTRILLPAQWCFLVGGLMMGTLYARQRFLVPALGPILYNVAQIVMGICFGRPEQLGIASMAWGALGGAVRRQHPAAALGDAARRRALAARLRPGPPRRPQGREADGAGPAGPIAVAAQPVDHRLLPARRLPLLGPALRVQPDPGADRHLRAGVRHRAAADDLAAGGSEGLAGVPRRRQRRLAAACCS